MRIPGSDAALRIGGLARMPSVNSFDPSARRTGSSPPRSRSRIEAARQRDRTTYTAQPSRFNLDLRTPTGVGAMRAFIEGDFASTGTGNLFRLRHAYGQCASSRSVNLVDLLRPRSRADRDRARGPECHLALPSGPVPLDAPRSVSGWPSPSPPRTPPPTSVRRTASRCRASTRCPIWSPGCAGHRAR